MLVLDEQALSLTVPRALASPFDDSSWDLLQLMVARWLKLVWIGSLGPQEVTGESMQ